MIKNLVFVFLLIRFFVGKICSRSLLILLLQQFVVAVIALFLSSLCIFSRSHSLTHIPLVAYFFSPVVSFVFCFVASVEVFAPQPNLIHCFNFGPHWPSGSSFRNVLMPMILRVFSFIRSTCLISHSQMSVRTPQTHTHEIKFQFVSYTQQCPSVSLLWILLENKLWHVCTIHSRSPILSLILEF